MIIQRLFIAGDTSEAIPHLLIVIDEFAELKKDRTGIYAGTD